MKTRFGIAKFTEPLLLSTQPSQLPAPIPSQLPLCCLVFDPLACDEIGQLTYTSDIKTSLSEEIKSFKNLYRLLGMVEWPKALPLPSTPPPVNVFCFGGGRRGCGGGRLRMQWRWRLQENVLDFFDNFVDI